MLCANSIITRIYHKCFFILLICKIIQVFLHYYSNNIYFLFDKDFVCQYVGKKGNNEGINYRLGLHLLKNDTKQTHSCIDEVCKYLNNINNSKRIIYVITFKIEPSYMAESVESYFIDYYRKINGAKWVKRK